MGLVAAASVAGNTFPIFPPWYSRTREMSGSDEEALLGADREDNTITVKIKTMLDDHNIGTYTHIRPHNDNHLHVYLHLHLHISHA